MHEAFCVRPSIDRKNWATRKAQDTPYYLARSPIGWKKCFGCISLRRVCILQSTKLTPNKSFTMGEYANDYFTATGNFQTTIKETQEHSQRCEGHGHTQQHLWFTFTFIRLRLPSSQGQYLICLKGRCFWRKCPRSDTKTILFLFFTLFSHHHHFNGILVFYFLVFKQCFLCCLTLCKHTYNTNTYTSNCFRLLLCTYINVLQI